MSQLVLISYFYESSQGIPGMCLFLLFRTSNPSEKKEVSKFYVKTTGGEV